MNSNHQIKNKKNNLPSPHILRILIPSKYIGTLIGKDGNHPIKEIHTTSNAKCIIDKSMPFRIFPTFSVKTITFVGDIEGVCKACRLVLDFIRNTQEANGTENKKYEVYVRFPNVFIGKLIGKKGSNIKKMIEETSSQITVSADSFIVSLPNDLYRYIPEILSNERTVVVSSDNILKVMSAIKKISEIRHEMNVNFNDKSIFPHMYGFQIPHLTNNILHFDNNLLRYQGNVYQNSFLNSFVDGRQALHPNNFINQTKIPVINTLKIFVPENCVGPVIGAKGSYIKFIISQSGTQVKIESSPGNHNSHETKENNSEDDKTNVNDENLNDDKLKDNKKDEALKNSSDRELLITGYGPNIQYAQQLIFLKIADTTSTHIDKLILTIEIQIPHEITGKVIGKQGKNINFLQRKTGAKVCILEGPTSPSNKTNRLTKVRIRGTIAAISNVQFRLQKIVVDNCYEKKNSHNNGESTL
ncbi:FI20063p1 [Strongyloides ratti]|uniref:FI20063p1 n=1 Tax=Strongyloides ratti TaxID=34506 RepID=A0A090L8W2_STRRB|nr:FI20063p1 [Strongyloides ratti]CEF63955.1 FI20063p1 [Strongyloides ratti]